MAILVRMQYSQTSMGWLSQLSRYLGRHLTCLTIYTVFQLIETCRSHEPSYLDYYFSFTGNSLNSL